MHIDVNSYQLMLGYTYEILHINGATSPFIFGCYEKDEVARSAVCTVVVGWLKGGWDHLS